VDVDITGDDNRVVISVKDTGVGIPAEDIPHLFQKFYRVDNSDTREIGGTGLGLYLCRKLTEVMGGQIWAESQYKQGSTFYIGLPRISHQEATQLKTEQENTAFVQQEQATQATAAPTPTPQPAQQAAVPAQVQQPAPQTQPAAPTPQPQPATAPARDTQMVAERPQENMQIPTRKEQP